MGAKTADVDVPKSKWKTQETAFNTQAALAELFVLVFTILFFFLPKAHSFLNLVWSLCTFSFLHYLLSLFFFGSSLLIRFCYALFSLPHCSSLLFEPSGRAVPQKLFLMLKAPLYKYFCCLPASSSTIQECLQSRRNEKWTSGKETTCCLKVAAQAHKVLFHSLWRKGCSSFVLCSVAARKKSSAASDLPFKTQAKPNNMTCTFQLASQCCFCCMQGKGFKLSINKQKGKPQEGSSL